MLVGELLWEFGCVAVILLAALGVIFFRTRFTKSKDPVPLRLWIRFTLVLFVLCVIGLIEGSLLSPSGFGWFILAMGVTLWVATRVLPRFIRLDR